MSIRRFWSNLKFNVKYYWNPMVWIPNIILCIRFPFLYGRNRFSGRHYTNWKLENLRSDAHLKAYEVLGEFGSEENPAHIVKVSNWYAFLEKFYLVLENIVSIFHIIPTWTELDAMDSGWRRTFGIQMCKEIKKALMDEGGRKALNRFRIDQIKEKYGSLCFYCHGGNEEVDKIIAKYEYISERTCIICGKSADYVTTGWVEPYCKGHLPEHIDPNDPEQVKMYYTEEFPFYGHYRINFNKTNKNETENDKGRV